MNTEIINKIVEISTKIADATSNGGAIGAYIGAGIAMMGALGCGIGEGIAAAKACEAVGRNPDAENKIRTMMIVGCAISETSGIYGVIIAILLIFVAPK